MRVAIIGAGISGLTLAYNLQKLGIPYDLFESELHVGGNIRTVQIKNYLLEQGPNSLLLNNELAQVIAELKLDNEVIEPAGDGHTRYFLKNGKLHRVPVSPAGIMFNPYFSLQARLDILKEPAKPKAAIKDETIAHFFERRFGREVADYAVSPFISAAYAGDAEQLIMSRMFPELIEMEAKYGSVLRGLIQEKEMFSRKIISFKNGLQTLPKAIASKLISLHRDHSVEMVVRNKGKFILSIRNGGELNAAEYDILVLALPAPKAADLLAFTFPGFSAALYNIQYPPMAVVHTAYLKSDVKFNLNGFGALHPKKEDPYSNGSIWSSAVFPDRCPEQEVLFTTFVGGSLYKANALAEKGEIQKKVHQELAKLYHITAAKPVYQHFSFWRYAIPQYNMYIEDAHWMAAALEPENVFVAANWLSGTSVPACMKHARELALKIKTRAKQVQTA